MTPTALHAIGKPAAAPVAAEQAASLTYEPYYGLQEKAFSLSADPRFLYKSRSHSLAFTELSTAIRRREGLVVLTGEIGTGKTTLCRAVLQSLDRRTFSAFIADPFLSREELLKILLVEFGVVSVADLKSGHLQGSTRQDLSYRLYDFLNSLVPLQAFAVVVVDEAQNLSLPLLEEIRILADLEWQEKLLQVVLVGQPELRPRLKLPQLRQVEQRVSMRCELTALGRQDVTSYVDHRLSVARGGASTVRFSPGALNVVHHASAGVPRLINLICDRALYEAHRLGSTHRVEAAIVWKALGALGLDVTPAKAPAEPGTGLIDVAEPAVVEPIVQPTVERIAPMTPPPPVTVTDDDIHEALAAAPVPAPDVVIPPGATLPADDSMAAFRSEADTVDVDAAAASKGSHSRVRFALAAAVVVLLAGVPATVWYTDAAVAFGGDLMVPALPESPALVAVTGAAEPADAPAVATIDLVISEPPVAVPPAYVVEVALFDSGERAARLVEVLAAEGHAAYSEDVQLGTRKFVQVLAGGFSTATEAEKALADIRQMRGYADARIRSESGLE